MTDNLEGKTIESVRKMTDKEMKSEHWTEDNMGSKPMVIVLEDGTKLYPSQDPEGNHYGALFGENPDGEKFGFP